MPKPRTFIEASSNGPTGAIRIVDRISEYSVSSSATIKTIVDDYLKTGVNEVEVYINSAGGNCFEAREMCNDLKRIAKVRIVVGSVAASAATYFLTQFSGACYPNSQFMIHRPKLGTYGDIVGITADLKLLQITTDEYKSAYSTKMNKTEDEIEAFFALGDYWMTANEALVAGLIDSILDTNETVTAESIKILEAIAAPIIPEINNENPIKMERLKLISRLKLAADASDEQIDKALKALEVAASRTEALEAVAKADLEANAKSLISGALLAKKFTADLEAHYLKLAQVDFEGTKTIIAAMQGVPKASDNLEANADDVHGTKNWTMEDFQEKNPQALAQMMSSDPERFKNLEAAYFGA